MRPFVGTIGAGLLVAGSVAAAAEHVVVMEGGAYAPERLTVRVGDTLRFVNRDTADHNVFVPTVGHAVDLGKQEPGQERTLSLARAGLIEVECVNHQGMMMQVEVLP